MHTSRIQQRFTAVLAALFVLSLLAVPATATHSWGKYHWATPTPGALPIGDNVDSVWDGHLDLAISDWNNLGGFGWTGPAPVKLIESPDGTNTSCKPISGTIEVCNGAYGNNGWLGLAQIWVSKNHITQATAKQNDTYFNTAPYNTAAWRQTVICQEIAHGFGLDHQDENDFNTNLGSCMDYTDDPAGTGAYGPLSNEHPNTHDFEQLAMIYNHTDTPKTRGGKGGGNNRSEKAIGNKPSNWGQVIARDANGRPSHYKKDLGDGRAVFTFVIWADGADAAAVEGTRDHGKKDDGKRNR